MNKIKIQRKGMPKAITYMLVAFGIYMYVMYRTTNSLDNLILGEISMPPNAYWVGLGTMGLILITGIITVLVNKHKITSFYLARAISFWMIQIPLLSALSFALITGIVEQELNVWMKVLLPSVFALISMTGLTIKTWKNGDDKALARQFDLLGNTSQRNLTFALLISWSVGLAGVWWGHQKWIYTTALTLQWTFTGLVYIRNGFKAKAKKYNNIFFSWIDPALPHVTMIAVLWYTFIGLFQPLMIEGIAYDAWNYMYSFTGIGLVVGLIGLHAFFKISIYRNVVLKNPMFARYVELLDNNDLKLSDLNPWRVIKYNRLKKKGMTEEVTREKETIL